MPTYTYKCTECGSEEDQIHGMKEVPEYKCSKCSSLMEKIFTPNIGGFIFKGRKTEASNYKEKRYRHKLNEDVSKRQKDRWGKGPKVRPNIAGVETDSWSDAQKMAKEAGLNHDSYTPLVEKEGKKIIV